jgi:hypothetical protein
VIFPTPRAKTGQNYLTQNKLSYFPTECGRRIRDCTYGVAPPAGEQGLYTFVFSRVELAGLANKAKTGGELSLEEIEKLRTVSRNKLKRHAVNSDSPFAIKVYFTDDDTAEEQLVETCYLNK